MPYADPTQQKAAQRAWYEREREAKAEGRVKPAPLEPVPIPADLRGAPKLVSAMRDNGRAAALVSQQAKRMDKLPFMSRARDAERDKLQAMNGHPRRDAPAVGVRREMERRVLLIVAGLIRGAEARGWEVETWRESNPPGGLPLLIDGERVLITWREELKQVRVKVERSFRIGSDERVELHPKGTLEFMIGGRRVRDGKRWQVEDRLAQMLQLAEEAVHERRRSAWDRAAQQQRWAEDEAKIVAMKAAAAAKREHAERLDARRQQVVALASDWRSASVVRDFAAALEGSADPEAANWRATAIEVAEQLDPLTAAASLPRWSVDA